MQPSAFHAGIPVTHCITHPHDSSQTHPLRCRWRSCATISAACPRATRGRCRRWRPSCWSTNSSWTRSNASLPPRARGRPSRAPRPAPSTRESSLPLFFEKVQPAILQKPLAGSHHARASTITDAYLQPICVAILGMWDFRLRLLRKLPVGRNAGVLRMLCAPHGEHSLR